MSTIARTDATGKSGMLPELVHWSSSFELDRSIAAEDLIGSAAHVTMLGKTGLIPVEDARALRASLLRMYSTLEQGREPAWPAGEEDIHMAVEAMLTSELGVTAERLHTARSRNDQIALDLHLYVRERSRQALCMLSDLIKQLLDRAESSASIFLPAYTHRQRAQPISAAFLICAWCAQLVRAGEQILFTLQRVDSLPLGSGACSGTSLPIDRALTARLLGFSRLSINALDTVGDRDFALDWSWASCRILLALGKIASDLIDYSTAEFGLVRLDGSIAAGSSMMPQKKNPDIFELLRSKSAKGIGHTVALLSLIKGLPSGYNRDQQEDRSSLLDTTSLLLGSLRAFAIAWPHVHFDPTVGHAALEEGFTQATDLAEALVAKGTPFREAYRAVGKLVRIAVESQRTLAQISVQEAEQVHPGFDAAALRVLHPDVAVEAKKSQGGTSSDSIREQRAALRQHVSQFDKIAADVPLLSALAERIAKENLG